MILRLGTNSCCPDPGEADGLCFIRDVSVYDRIAFFRDQGLSGNCGLASEAPVCRESKVDRDRAID